MATDNAFGVNMFEPPKRHTVTAIITVWEKEGKEKVNDFELQIERDTDFISLVERLTEALYG